MTPSHCLGFCVMARISRVPPTERSLRGPFDSSEHEAISAANRMMTAAFRYVFMVLGFFVGFVYYGH